MWRTSSFHVWYVRVRNCSHVQTFGPKPARISSEYVQIFCLGHGCNGWSNVIVLFGDDSVRQAEFAIIFLCYTCYLTRKYCSLKKEKFLIRRAFVKLYWVVLCLFFSYFSDSGEWSLMDNVYCPRIQRVTKKYLGFPIPFVFYGKSVCLPRQRALTIVIGEPITAASVVDSSTVGLKGEALVDLVCFGGFMTTNL